MSAPVHTRGEASRLFDPDVRQVGYDRYEIDDRSTRVFAQMLVVDSEHMQMDVRASKAALTVDFRTHVTRPDLKDAPYRPRPGLYLHDVLGGLRRAGRPAIVFNGNNVGWWGNQFVIRQGRLVYKRKGPIFDDGNLREYADGSHSFFSAGAAGFEIKRVPLTCDTRTVDDTQEIDLRAAGLLPDYGLSGFPLLQDGQAVWREHGELAWDPGLLFDLGPPLGRERRGVLRDVVRELLNKGSEDDLVRHALTVIGLDARRNIVLLVVERSTRSRGMTVAEAADLLRDRGVRDALVLGAAGDAQLATTTEGFLTTPLVTPYTEGVARRIHRELLHEERVGPVAYARPIPCYVVLRHCRSEAPLLAPALVRGVPTPLPR